ncbi:MAG TPA: hypothetical protein VEH06_17050 [Candidatus Bathyarchaeia archaeon]|nr:hypothetical protein [Candidatus Bathyarchaeia archaeon]
MQKLTWRKTDSTMMCTVLRDILQRKVICYTKNASSRKLGYLEPILEELSSRHQTRRRVVYDKILKP